MGITDWTEDVDMKKPKMNQMSLDSKLIIIGIWLVAVAEFFELVL